MKTSIPRTATFAWSPASLQTEEPYIATGTVAGALDENFSNESVIEIWKPDYGSNNTASLKPIASTPTSAKLNSLSWGLVHPQHPKGVLAAGLENGELGVWDAQKVIDGDSSSAQILKNSLHTGPIKGIDFNPTETRLLATGAVKGEIYIWDLLNPTQPHSPGATSSKLDEISSLAWNPQVSHILASASSSTGYTVVWDLKNKREVVSLSYGGGSATAGPNGAASTALSAGGRRGMSAVAWHPTVATRLATASDDDSSPVIMLWDLRNARAPEKILTGHDKGVLSLAWCKQDSDLLLSCGKDNRTIAWNPQSSEIVGELPASRNWSFDVQWCPRNPDLLATASFDGQVGVHSLQATNQTSEGHAQRQSISAPPADGSDIFNLPATASEAPSQGLTLKQPPKWLKRPVSATFGYGGQLVTVSNSTTTPGQPSTSSVQLRDVVTEPGIVSRAQRLQDAIETQGLAQFCDERSKEAAVSRPDDVANWKALQTLFQADSRDELVALLGFSKEDVAAKVASAISTYKSAGSTQAGLDSTPGTPSVRQGSARGPASTISEPDDVPPPHEPVVSFAQDGLENTPSEASTAISSEPKATTEGGESEVTEPSLFSDGDNAASASTTGADQSGVEFFNSISGESGAGVRSAVPERVLVPHVSVPPASSVAATAGSPGPSSVASVDIRPATFRIYPADESEADRLITRALVLGDFESAVGLCISTERFADALLLAVRGGPDLLARTQKTYFERRTTSLPYLRVFQSIVSDDLADIVQNADLNEWSEVFVVLCTFAKPEEFSNLAEQLGQRLEFQYVKSSGAPNVASDSGKLGKAKSFRKNAILCYLAAGKLEKVAGMWIDEMKEEEAAIRAAQKQIGAAGDASALVNGTAAAAASDSSSLYSAHAEALQTFIEKITVFQNAVGYVDTDLQQPTTNAEVAATGARTYKLAALYDRIHEYVELLADQGLITSALKYVNQTPADYVAGTDSAVASASPAVGVHPARERLLQADTARTGGQGAASAAASTSRAATSAYAPSQPAATTSAYNPYGAVPAQQDPYSYGAPVQQQVPVQQQPPQPPQQQQQPTYGAYAPSVPQVPQVIPPTSSPYNTYDAPQQTHPAAQNNAYAPQQPMVPAPPPPITESAYGLPPSQQQQQQQAVPPPPPKRAEGGWNDVPTLANAPKRTASALGQKTAPIMSPFPNSPAPTPGPYGQQHHPGAAVPPPPRGSTPGARSFASPPPQGPGFGRGAPQGARPPPPPRAGSAAGMRAPPLPGQGGVPPVPGVPNVPVPGATGQSNPYAPQQQQQGPPPHQQQQQRGPPGPPGPYGPPPGQQQQQQGGPPQQQHLAHQQGPPGMAPLGPPGAARPPPGAPINRSQTPGAGAGAPLRSQTPAGGRPGAASQFKYPPGDRSHIPEAQRVIFQVLSRELARIKATTPPAQKRMVDDTERRLNILFDHLNNGLITDGKLLGGLTELARAVDARNQQAALGIHVQLVTTASGDIAAALVGVKMVISRMGA